MKQQIFRKKLIEVDLPLDEINQACIGENYATLHKYWARRPLAACRVVIFASMVDDPSECADEFPSKEQQDAERKRLHEIIKALVVSRNTNESNPQNVDLLSRARYEIARSVARAHDEVAPIDPSAVLNYLEEKTLPIYDPFAGGGSIPIEAQRLGLNAVASDLNPVAVLINKMMVEFPAKFAGITPINPQTDQMGIANNKPKDGATEAALWRGSAGLSDDIRYYGNWMGDRLSNQMKDFYPKANMQNGEETPIIAWLWVRTVPCPNPACGVQMPLARTFQVSRRRNNDHWIKPVLDRDTGAISFEVQDHSDGVPEGSVNRTRATCVACQSVTPLSYVREQAKANNMRQQMTALVAEGGRRPLYLPVTPEQLQIASKAEPDWRPSGRLPEQALGFRVQGYGFTEWHQLFTQRQLLLLTTLCDILMDVRTLIEEHGASPEYGEALCTYLAMAVSRTVHYSSSFTRWRNDQETVVEVFPRGALPMIWDFAEGNPFSASSTEWKGHVERIAKVMSETPSNVNEARVYQADASTTVHIESGPIIVTDPPYYDNVAYADLSDFFYVWLRPMLRKTYPDLFASILTPKTNEMTASPRFEDPNKHFNKSMSDALTLMKDRCAPEFPSSIFYAYKQQTVRKGSTISTGWESMLKAVVEAGFRITGTWPMRTERRGRLREIGSNALASSVILVCRPRVADAPVATRRQFLDELENRLPEALNYLTREGHIAPVDLAQAAIGPGMEIYSKYSRVETISGEPVPISNALAEINRVIGEHHRQEQGALDSGSQFCLDWLREYAYGEERYGQAELLAQAKNVSVESMRSLLAAESGTVKLLPPDQYGPDTQMSLGDMTAWEGCFRMAYHLNVNRENGEGIAGAAKVAQAMGSNADSIERLARILYDHYDTKNDSQNAVLFNNLATSWRDILAAIQPHPEQATFL